MTTDSIAAGRRPGVDWRRAEFVLTLLAFVGFLTLPIRITTIYSGLPAHPLFVHVPVVLIPTTIVAAIVFVFKRDWLSRYGIALALVSIVAMSSSFLAMQAGAALRGELHLQGQAATLISEHSQAAHILAIVYVLFTATLIVTFAAQRISGGMPTGLAIVDELLSPKAIPPRCAYCSCCLRSAPATCASGPATSVRKRCGRVGWKPLTVAASAVLPAKKPRCSVRSQATSVRRLAGTPPTRRAASSPRAGSERPYGSSVSASSFSSLVCAPEMVRPEFSPGAPPIEVSGYSPAHDGLAVS